MKKISKDIYLIKIQNKNESDRIIGVIEHKHSKCILIDTGLNKKDAQKILKELKKKYLKPEIIINTHFHADHSGGNSYIQKASKAKILASEFEGQIINCAEIGSYLFNSGARLSKDTIDKYLTFKSSKVKPLLEINKVYHFGDKKLKIIDLAGHTPHHIGVEVDDILFCGDGILANTDIIKHKIPLYCDIKKIKATLKRVKNGNKKFVLSHYGITEDINKHIVSNLKVLNELEQNIIKSLHEEKSTERLIQEIFDKKGIKIKNMQEYLIKRVTILAGLSYLKDCKKIDYKITNNNILWFI